MRRLYWEDPYLVDFEGTITRVSGDRVALDRTAFYAEGGGQVGDTGTINGLRVLDTQYGDDKREIQHIIEPSSAKLLQPGQTVCGVVDWERRYRVMRNHTALHILFLLFQEEYGDHRIIGSQVREDKARVDFEYFGLVDVEQLTARFADIIGQNLAVVMQTDPLDPEQRTWAIAGHPTIPCGGTHVRSTKEVGEVHIKRKGLGSQGVRLYCTADGPPGE